MTTSPTEQLIDTVYARVGPSQLEGVGIIAIRDMPAGTAVEAVPEVSYGLSPEEFALLPKEIKTLILDQALQHDERVVRFYHPNLMLHSFMNHASEPNTDGKVTLRDVHAGEELTKDYRTHGNLAPLSAEHYKPFLK